MHFGKPEKFEMQKWWNAPIEALKDNLRNNVQSEYKKIILLAMGIGAIKNDEPKISKY